MTQDLEQELRALFTADAAHSPAPAGLVSGSRRKVRRTRTLRVTAAVVLLAVGGLTTASLSNAPVPSPRVLAAPSTEANSPDPSPSFSAATGSSGMASCVYRYSPAEVAKRAFAFDGTVLSFAPGKRGYQVTFQVHQWFRADGGSRITVSMPSPYDDFSRTECGDGAPRYGIGTRLLVSGDPWRGRRGEVRGPLENPVALFGSGGFTRLWTAEDAALWAAATR